MHGNPDFGTTWNSPELNSGSVFKALLRYIRVMTASCGIHAMLLEYPNGAHPRALLRLVRLGRFESEMLWP